MDWKIANRTAKDKPSPTTMLASKPQEPFRFLDLPAEVRNLIYEHVIDENTEEIDLDWKDSSSGVVAMSPACRQLRSETLPLLYDSKVVLIHMDQLNWTRGWMYKWEPGMATHLRHIQLEGFQHFHYDRPRRHQLRCASAIKIDLRQTKNPVTYSKDLQCKDCPEFEESVACVESVVKDLEKVNRKLQLTKQAFIDILRAARHGRYSRMIWC